MKMHYPPLELRVWGKYACFTRPEMKTERVSYPVMTPSAARGVLEAVFWKPEFSWRIQEIWMLKEVRFASILRNEVNQKATVQSAKRSYFAEDDRAQRHSLILQDVAYLIKADIAVKPGVSEDPAKFRDQFRRRVNRGQSYHRPYLGCREFAADFNHPVGDENPIPLTEELGWMLFDLEFKRNDQGKGISAQPLFFQANLENGILKVPQDKYQEVL
jgi:CRISPR-associated protein Cas5d